MSTWGQTPDFTESPLPTPVKSGVGLCNGHIAPDEGKREFHLTCRLYFYPELARMLNHAGLVPVQVFGDYEGSEYGWDSGRMIILAEKRRET